MEIEQIKDLIVCDIQGCGNLAEYQIKMTSNDESKDTFKICKTCAKNLYKGLSGISEVSCNVKGKCKSV